MAQRPTLKKGKEPGLEVAQTLRKSWNNMASAWRHNDISRMLVGSQKRRQSAGILDSRGGISEKKKVQFAVRNLNLITHVMIFYAKIVVIEIITNRK